jgi:hypothetical protein
VPFWPERKRSVLQKKERKEKENKKKGKEKERKRTLGWTCTSLS